MDRQDIANVYVRYNEQTKSIRDWCKELHLNYATVRVRYIRGAKGDKLFAPTNNNPKPIDLNAFLGDEMFQQVAELSAHFQTTPAKLVRHMVTHGITKMQKMMSSEQ